MRYWPAWLAAAPTSLLVWMGLTALTMTGAGSPFLPLQVADDLSFVLACFCSCFAVLALVLKFAGRPLRRLQGLKQDAYGMYLVHYVFVVWLQFALLGVALTALVKGALVFGGVVLLSHAVIALIRQVPQAAEVLGTGRARNAAAQPSG